jgi:hypothetical protein
MECSVRSSSVRFIKIGAALSATIALLPSSIEAQSMHPVIGWGDNNYGKCNVPPLPSGVGCVDIDAGFTHSIALLSDGSVIAWGDNKHGQCNVPALPPGTACAHVSAGGQFASYVPALIAAHSLALLSDGSALAWGYNGQGQCYVPPLPPGVRYAAVDAGGLHSVFLRSDGIVVVSGDDTYGQRSNIPDLPPGLKYVEIDAGDYYTLARRNDGSAVAWGRNLSGECDVPALPAGVKYVEVSAAGTHSIARRSDGSVVAWGENNIGQCNVPPLASGLHYTGVDAGDYFSLAVRSDGSLIAWGSNASGQCSIPQLPFFVVVDEASAGLGYVLARLSAPVGYAESYCDPAAPNSVSPTGAHLEPEGGASVATNSLMFNVADLPPGKPGIFFYGPYQTQIPFGNGWVCVGGPVVRITPEHYASASGTVTFPVDLTQHPFNAGPGQIVPGSTWNFQYWYRDPGGGLSTFNLSNAVQVVFAP